MPTYGYRCTSCGHQFEVFQRMSDDPVQTCPNCQGKVTRILYPAGVVFKGSGYYSTDYKGSGSSASSNGSGSSSDGKSESKSEPKSESKPESKSEAGD
ncbi:MAG TPA: zinc ribbon domain-containing protein [Candidatus Dormibacteraeota bacterium]|nr:zinc ribbon domain-containing protein [Candidatus Dormibacteraeota bacterium]